MEDGLKATKSLGAMFSLLDEQPTQTAADQAQWFVDHAIAVVPAKGKTPIGGVYAAKLSTEGITTGYGIALGNCLIALDYDSYHGAVVPVESFPKTRMTKSGSGKGYHLYYKVPEDLIFGGELHQGITIRGLGSIVIGPGSKHPDGGTYELVNDCDIADAPEVVLKKLRELKDAKERQASSHIAAAVQPDWLFKDSRFVEKFGAAPGTDRSAQTYELAAYAVERGSSNEELAWLLSNFEAAISKGNVEKELLRIVEKLRHLHEHSGKPCDVAKCPNVPDWMSKGVEVFDFWNARPEFAYIKQAADNRLVAERPVMIATLCRLATAIPTEVVLPPLVGGRNASLNFFACFVGESSEGKSTSVGLAEMLFDFKQTGLIPTTSTPGSGEGVVSTYLKIKDNRWQQLYESALINFDEIDNLSASSDRQGSTLSAILRQAFMGEQIGGTYSKTTKELLPHSYRMALQLSAQPLRSEGLLKSADGGLPQRFVFVQTTDPGGPSIDDLPGFPSAVRWRTPSPILELKESKKKASQPNETLGKLDTPVELVSEDIVIELDETIVREIKIARIERKKGKAKGTNGHRNLVCLKIAALLGILDGRLDVNTEDWKLAKHIMTWSDQALTEINEALSHKKLKEEQSRTTLAVNRAKSIEQSVEDTSLKKVCDRIMLLVNKGVTQISGVGNLKQSIRAVHRQLFEEALELLIEQNKLEITNEGKNVIIK